MKISTRDKIDVSLMSLVSIASIISFLFYVIFFINYAYQYGLPKRDDSEPIYEFISKLGFYITLGPFLLLGAVASIMEIAITLERDNVKIKKLKKEQKKVLLAFIVFMISSGLFLVIPSLSYNHAEVENVQK